MALSIREENKQIEKNCGPEPGNKFNHEVDQGQVTAWCQ